MAFQYRFPHAILHYIGDERNMQAPIMRNAIEKIRDWAIPLDNERRKKPTLEQAEEYLEEIIKEWSFYEGVGYV